MDQSSSEFDRGKEKGIGGSVSVAFVCFPEDFPHHTYLLSCVPSNHTTTPQPKLHRRRLS